MKAYCHTCCEPRNVPIAHSGECDGCGGRLSAPPKDRKPMKRSRGPKPSRGKRHDRSPAEKALAEVWHRFGRQKCGGFCVRADCESPADEYAHHLIEKSWLIDKGLEAHVWDDENSCPICWPCHARHTGGEIVKGSKVTRDELIAKGLWAPAVAWAKDLDARYFGAGHEPVLSKLERNYPAAARCLAVRERREAGRG